METTATSRSSYIYDALEGPDNIRVMFLAPGSRDDPLACRILHTPVTSPAHYEALSYVWGTEEPRSTLHICNCGVNFVDFPRELIPSEVSSIIDVADEGECLSNNNGCGTKWITPNLEMALKRLRYSENYRPLWADSVRINQDDNAEKSSQVRKMRQIFSSAYRVDAHLGEEFENSHLVPKLVTLLSEMKITPEMQPYLADRSFYGAHETSVVPKDLDNTGGSCCPYIAVICGPWEISWAVLGIAVVRAGMIPKLAESDKSDPELSNTYIQRRTLSASGLITAMRLKWVQFATQHGVDLDLLELLLGGSCFQATRDRDKLFALLGVASNTEDPLLDPNYDEPFGHVIARYARYFVEKYHSPMSMLCTAEAKSVKDGSLPSWVPNFITELATRSFHHISYSESRSFYKAATEIEAQMKIGETPRILIVSGMITDSLAHVAEKRTFTKNEIIQQSDVLLSKLSSYPTGEDLVDVQWRTLISNRSGRQGLEDGVAAASLRESYFAYRETWLKMGSSSDRSALGSFGDSISQPLETAAAYDHELTNGRPHCPCITSRGYFGMAPREAKAGDVIFIALGAPTPLILRRSEKMSGHYQVYGVGLVAHP